MIKDLFNGMSSYLTAIQLTAKHRLWGYFVIPAIVTILLGAAIFYGAWQISGNIGNYISNIYPWEWGSAYVDEIGQVFGGLLVAALGLILFKNLVVALASPFMSFLSEKIERILYGGESPKFTTQQFISDLVRGIRIAIRLVVRELLFTILLFLVGLIPVFAPVIPFALFAVQSYYAGAGNMDFTLERYYRVRGSVQFVRRNRGLAVGNGIIYLLLYFTVIGFVFALPLSTIAGTVEAMKKIKKEEVA
ncbi:MAG TPA: EI24 domain-containing protein [Saprospiraceae bacterium]|nr:EI24 domain-containing protein [Saprospiraceae bacterium]